MKQRRFLPTLSELLDRLSIVQLKEVFITEHKEEYAQEMLVLRENESYRKEKILCL